MSGKTVWVFLDEGGNLDFSPSGTRFFTLTAVARRVEPPEFQELHALRKSLLSNGVAIPYFHAAEDKQHVRDAVFKIICEALKRVRIDSLIVEKPKTGTALQDPMLFYPKMLWYLLDWVIQKAQKANFGKIVVVTDTLPISKKRRAVEKAIQAKFASLKPLGIKYEIIHEPSKNHIELQVADYCNWAIYRKWSRNDLRSYSLIKSQIRSEFDIFRTGTRFYYNHPEK
ncbi:MAG: DUF3800 domain-containing protein [Chthoniobacteraceae bacterium]